MFMHQHGVGERVEGNEGSNSVSDGEVGATGIGRPAPAECWAGVGLCPETCRTEPAVA
jgi:hypothetical protein